MYNATLKEETAKLSNLIQVATENEQPITLNLSLGVFQAILGYQTEQALAAYREEQEREVKERNRSSLVTPMEAKKSLGVSDATLWRYVKNGLLHKKQVGGKVYYSRNEIDKLMEG